MAEERKACVSPVTSFLQNIDLVRRQLRGNYPKFERTVFYLLTLKVDICHKKIAYQILDKSLFYDVMTYSFYHIFVSKNFASFDTLFILRQMTALTGKTMKTLMLKNFGVKWVSDSCRSVGPGLKKFESTTCYSAFFGKKK